MPTLMRRAFSLAIVLILALGATAQGNAMEVIFKPDMDKEALERIKKEAKENGLELTYTRMDFKEGRLTSLGFVLKTRKGMGSAETDGLGDDDTFGFSYLPNRKGGDPAFMVGTLKPPGTQGTGPDK